MKTGLVIGGVVVVAALAYFLLMQPAAPTMDGSPSIGMPAPGNEGNYPEPQAKIDINVVCNGALAYMTFQTGNEAEAFVEACVRGEHPEVIEQWKVQMGITDDRAI
jgi:hypothetical protein